MGSRKRQDHGSEQKGKGEERRGTEKNIELNKNNLKKEKKKENGRKQLMMAVMYELGTRHFVLRIKFKISKGRETKSWNIPLYP